MTKENTRLFDAEANLQLLIEDGAGEAAIQAAKDEVRYHKLATREFVIGMVQERMIWIGEIDLQEEERESKLYELRHVLDGLLGEIEYDYISEERK